MKGLNICNSTPRIVVCAETKEDSFYFPNGAKLEKGKKYNMVRMEVLAFHTHVYLAEFPNLPFNSVQFGEVSED